MTDTVRALQQVLWTTSPVGKRVESRLFASRGIPHGFTGKGHDGKQFHYPRQVHGTDIVVADVANKHTAKVRPEADGIFTTQPEVTIAVRTADCLPVLAVSGNLVIAIHAGWRGLCAGILTRSMQVALRQAGSPYTDAEHSLWAIGPAIGHASYEVGPELVVALSSCELSLSAEQIALCLTKGEADRWFLDLQTAAVCNLLNLGVLPQHIDVIRLCTYTAHESFYSYRFTQKHSGSNWSFVALPC